MKEIIPKSKLHNQGYRGYETTADRERAITMLKRQGFNHFVCYCDSKAEVALSYAIAEKEN